MKSSEVARSRMHNSHLIGAPFNTPEEAVSSLCAMQAQDFGPAKWSIGQRSKNLFDEDIDRAIAAGSILRTHVLRPTWHFVARDDLRWLLALTGPRVHQRISRRYEELGLDSRTLARSESLIASALSGGNHLTRDDIAEVFTKARFDGSGQRLPYILMHCELEGLICSGALRGKKQTYALLDDRVPDDHRFDRERAMGDLVRRYLAGHGPATVQDLRWWSSLAAAEIRKTLDMLGAEVSSKTVEGLTFWWAASQDEPLPSTRVAHLLPPYDELLVGYSESRYFGDPRAGAAKAAWRDRTLPNGVVLLNARVGGLWRRSVAEDAIRVQVLTYEELGSNEARAMKDAVANLGRFLGRTPTLDMAML